MKECVLLGLLALCSAKPLFRPSYVTLKDMMLKDTEDEGDGDTDSDNSLFPTRESISPFFPFDLFPTCPFGCQCYSRVVHCSDLGKDGRQLTLESVILTKRNRKGPRRNFKKELIDCKGIFRLNFWEA